MTSQDDGSSEVTLPTGDDPTEDVATAEVAMVPVVDVVPAGKRTSRRRTWPQRGLLALNCIVVLACFVGAGGLIIGRNYRSDFATIALETPSTTAAASTATTGVAETTVAPAPGETAATVDTTPAETFPPADPKAVNFLITGADNNACVDPNSPYAAAFGDRETMGQRSDTIMVMRVDPSSKRAAILSFPRDLWVNIDGKSGKGRINSAYVRDDPQRLINTLFANDFGILIDHFIQIDFCAFKSIVDAVGGVAVPFTYPARDRHSGLNVPTTGCFNFDGDHALAYVRSRYYQYQTEDGKWHTDGLSDLGRISRQQDFIRRMLSAVLGKGILDPAFATDLIDAAQQNVVIDAGLSLSTMLQLVGVLRDFDPAGISTYQIEATGQTISGQAVLVPKIKGENMQAILEIFRGHAPLAGAPEQVFQDPSTTTPTATATTVSGSGTLTATTTGVDTATTITPTEPTVVGPEENTKGIFPDKNVSC